MEGDRGPSPKAGPRVAILAEGRFARATAKTAIGVLRYAPYPVVAVIDSTRAGTDAWQHIGGRPRREPRPPRGPPQAAAARRTAQTVSSLRARARSRTRASPG